MPNQVKIFVRYLIAVIIIGLALTITINWETIKSYGNSITSKSDSRLSNDICRLVNKELYFFYTDQMYPELENLYTASQKHQIGFKNSEQFLNVVNDASKVKEFRLKLLSKRIISKSVTDEIFHRKLNEWRNKTGKKLSETNSYKYLDQVLLDFNSESAIELAKHSLLYCNYTSDCDSLNNDDYIKTSLVSKKGIIVSRGWHAKEVGDKTYLVTYFFEEDNELYAYALEVNLPIDGVRNVFNNETLENKYWNINEKYDSN